MRMSRHLLTLIAGTGLISSALAQTVTIVDDDFNYGAGDLAGQGNWVESTAVGTYGSDSFHVSGGAASTAAAPRPDVNTNFFVYLTGTPTGNATDDEWSGSMAFTIDFNTNKWWSGSLFAIGTSTTAADYLTGGSNQVDLALGTDWPNHFTIGTHDGDGSFKSIMPAIDHVEFGMDITGGDDDSDLMVLNWHVRKTRDTGVYTLTAAVSNTVTGTNFPGSTVAINVPDAYADTDPVYMMGQMDGASWTNYLPAGFRGWKHIAVDSLNITRTSGVAPVLQPAAVTAVGGSGEVILSWEAVVEAQTYDVLMSTTVDGIYSVVSGGSNITETEFTVTGLADGTTYFFKVRAEATGATSSESEPISATPVSVMTGTIIDTDFTAGDGYSDGDLDGQFLWKHLTASDPEAFYVTTASNGVADSTPFQAGAPSTNQVYWNAAMSNSVGAMWSGSIKFKLSAILKPDTYKTNIYMEGETSVTNIHQIGNPLYSEEAFTFGVMADTANQMTAKDGAKDDVLICTRIDSINNGVKFGLNMYAWNANVMLDLNRWQVGWDPQWLDNPTGEPDLDSDWITLDYSIRKTTKQDAYSGVVTATIGTNVYEGTLQNTGDDSWYAPGDAYDADLLTFGMSRLTKDNTNRLVNIIIDSLAVVHTNNSETPITAPFNIGASPGNNEVTLSWDTLGEQDGFNIFRAETNGGPYVLLASTTNETYVDSGLTDKRTYFYILQSEYPGPVYADSEQIIFRSLGRTENPGWDGDVNPGGGIELKGRFTPISTNNGIIYTMSHSAYPGYALTDPAEWDYERVKSVLYAIVQVETNSSISKFELSTYGTLDHILPSGSASLIWVEKQGTPYDATSAEVSIATDKYGPGQSRAAIRNNGTWYVSKSSINSGGLSRDNLLDELWAPLDVPLTGAESTYWMSAPTNAADYIDMSSTFTGVEAVGVFTEGHSGAREWLKPLKLVSGTVLNAYENWTDDNEIYNEDARATDDPDGDGKNNVYEWGLGGDPADSADIGITDVYGSYDGTFMVYVHPILKGSDDERPTYQIIEADDLILANWGDTLNATSQEGGAWPGHTNDFNAMTNWIPVAKDYNFFQLDIKE